MNRLTETKFEKEMRIGFSKIDRIFDDAISKLDDMKAEYEAKLQPKPNKIIDDIYALLAKMQGQPQLQGLFMGDRSYAALQKMPMSFDRGGNDILYSSIFPIGSAGFTPIYRNAFIASGVA